MKDRISVRYEADGDFFEDVVIKGLELALVWGTVAAGVYGFSKVDDGFLDYQRHEVSQVEYQEYSR